MPKAEHPAAQMRHLGHLPGLVVISSCGHTGIVNTVHTAMEAAKVDQVHAIIGGFHLGAAPQNSIEHTIDAMEKLAPDVVVPMHCSGTPFSAAACPTGWR